MHREQAIGARRHGMAVICISYFGGSKPIIYVATLQENRACCNWLVCTETGGISCTEIIRLKHQEASSPRSN